MSTTEFEMRETRRDSETCRRSRMEMYFDILHSIDGGEEKPTRIMYKANLCWVVASERIEWLENQGFISSAETEGRRTYHLTDRGRNLLESYLALRNHFYL